jgi:hypothetical protein
VLLFVELCQDNVTGWLVVYRLWMHRWELVHEILFGKEVKKDKTE